MSSTAKYMQVVTEPVAKEVWHWTDGIALAFDIARTTATRHPDDFPTMLEVARDMANAKIKRIAEYLANRGISLPSVNLETQEDFQQYANNLRQILVRLG